MGDLDVTEGKTLSMKHTLSRWCVFQRRPAIKLHLKLFNLVVLTH